MRYLEARDDIPAPRSSHPHRTLLRGRRRLPGAICQPQARPTRPAPGAVGQRGPDPRPAGPVAAGPLRARFHRLCPSPLAVLLPAPPPPERLQPSRPRPDGRAWRPGSGHQATSDRGPGPSAVHLRGVGRGAGAAHATLPWDAASAVPGRGGDRPRGQRQGVVLRRQDAGRRGRPRLPRRLPGRPRQHRGAVAGRGLLSLAAGPQPACPHSRRPGPGIGADAPRGRPAAGADRALGATSRRGPAGFGPPTTMAQGY